MAINGLTVPISITISYQFDETPDIIIIIIIIIIGGVGLT
jgi:hypothetical protein